VATRDQYRITGLDLESVKSDLNFALTRIADRLDKLEGIRGKTDFDGESLVVSGPVVVRDDDDEQIHSME